MAPLNIFNTMKPVQGYDGWSKSCNLSRFVATQPYLVISLNIFIIWSSVWFEKMADLLVSSSISNVNTSN